MRAAWLALGFFLLVLVVALLASGMGSYREVALPALPAPRRASSPDTTRLAVVSVARLLAGHEGVLAGLELGARGGLVAEPEAGVAVELEGGLDPVGALHGDGVLGKGGDRSVGHDQGLDALLGLHGHLAVEDPAAQGVPPAAPAAQRPGPRPCLVLVGAHARGLGRGGRVLGGQRRPARRHQQHPGHRPAEPSRPPAESPHEVHLVVAVGPLSPTSWPAQVGASDRRRFELGKASRRRPTGPAATGWSGWAAWSGRPRPAARRAGRPGRPGRAGGSRTPGRCGRRHSGGG